MSKDKLWRIAPYAGLPIIGFALFFLQTGRTEAFYLLQQELLIIFGYLAAISDLKAKKISNTLILGMLAAWVITFAPQLFFHTERALAHLTEAALGFAVGGGVFLFLYLVSRGGLGGGDVKFIAAAGLYVGLNNIFPVMLYGTVLAGLTALTLLLLKRIKRKDSLPLAPFLYIGILILLFFA